jgi:hypothetical protein
VNPPAVPEYQPFTDRHPEIKTNGKICNDCAAPTALRERWWMGDSQILVSDNYLFLRI